MTSRLLRAMLALQLGLCITACGGGHHAASLSTAPQSEIARAIPALSPTPPATDLIGQLPAVPAPERLTMPRMVASIDAGALASQFTSHGGDVTLNGTHALFDSTPDHVSWAIYSFGGNPGEVISKLNYVVTGLNAGEKLYCAISDYVANRWLFLPLQAGSVVNFDLPNNAPGAYQSALGNTSVLFAVFGGDNFELANLSLTYADRHSITGSVIDKTGAPVEGVTIKTPVGSLSTVTDASGNYTLMGLPDGAWPVLATKDGWTFYPQPQMVTVAGADAAAGDVLGDPHGAHYDVTEALPNNNTLQTAPLWDFAANGPLHDSISADNDYLDSYRFNVPAAGTYLLKFHNEDRNILSPVFAVLTPQVDSVLYGEDILCGEEAISVTVSDPALPLQFLLGGGGGGGKYTVSLTQEPTGRLGLGLQNGGDQRFRAIYKVVRQDTSFETDYYSNSLINAGTSLAVFDRSYPVGDVQVTPVLANHTIAPVSANLSVLADGSVASQLFTFTAPAIADSYEPNNSSGTAFNLGATPYNSAVPLQITADYGGDYTDVYKITPPAGQGLRVSVLYAQQPGESVAQSRLTLNIENHFGASVSNSFHTANGITAEISELTDGSPYTIYLYAFPTYPPDGELINYALQATAFPAHRFQIGARVGGITPVDGMKFVIYDNTFSTRYVAGNETADFLTVPRYVADGSQFRVDCYRMNTPFDGLTQLVTVTGDTTLNFDAANLGADSHEPNGTLATASALGFLPATISATYSAFDDDADWYSFGPGDGRPFKFELLETGPGQGLTVSKYDSGGVTQGSQILHGAGSTVYLPNDGNPGQSIRISTYNDYNFAYKVRISNTNAYKISGVVKNTAVLGIDAVVVNTTTGARAYAKASAGGAYAFTELLAPGDYALKAYAIGYSPAFQSQTATIAASDTTADFLNFLLTPDDNYEPNDTAATAHAIALNTDYMASVSNLGGSPDVDYYTIPLNPGDRVRITVTPGQAWEKAQVTLLDQYSTGSSEDYLGRATLTSARQIDYTADAAYSYVLKVEGLNLNDDDAGRYTLRVQKMN